MSGSRYLISNQHAPYFITSTVIHWIDLFTRRNYKDIVVDSLNYCIENKNLTVFAWIIMSNHIHLVAQCDPPGKMSDFLRDFKKFTSKKFIDGINEGDWTFSNTETQRIDEYLINVNDQKTIVTSRNIKYYG